MPNSQKEDRQPVTVHVSMTFRRRGGRKLVITPDGISAQAVPCARIDNTMVKAIARGYRWRKLLETGVHATIEDMAAAEKITPSYVSRLLRLSLLAPDIVEAILDGRQPETFDMKIAIGPFPIDWSDQRTLFRVNSAS